MTYESARHTVDVQSVSVPYQPPNRPLADPELSSCTRVAHPYISAPPRTHPARETSWLCTALDNSVLHQPPRHSQGLQSRSRKTGCDLGNQTVSRWLLTAQTFALSEHSPFQQLDKGYLNDSRSTLPCPALFPTLLSCGSRQGQGE